MKKIRLFLVVVFIATFGRYTYAQEHIMPVQKTFRVAVFAPLYLDSVFEKGILKNDKTIPRLIVPGLDFVQGAMIAFDTINLAGKKVEAHIFDARPGVRNVEWQINNRQLDNMDLIIGSVRDPEHTQLALFAQRKNIPFVAATFPNSGGIRNNPNLLIVNSTLKAHVEGIYSYLLQKHGTDNIYLFRQKNDKRIENYFDEVNTVEGKKLLNIRPVLLDSSISAEGIRKLIDTSRQVIIIGASLDETFATNLADAIYPVAKGNPLLYMGMPNWDGFRNFLSKNTYPDFPIYFTSPHYDLKKGPFSRYLNDKYFEKYRIYPSDNASKGFETALYFTSILLNHPDEFMDHINSDKYAPLHTFLFRPVNLNKNSDVTDFFENKHVFIMKILNGEISRGF